MDRDQARSMLDLSPGADEAAVRAAYKLRARPLKRGVITALTAQEKREHRDALRELVSVRNIALGLPPPDAWSGNSLGISGIEICERLSDCDPLFMNARRARSILDLARDCTAEQVRVAFQLRRRALLRRFAKARNEAEMTAIRQAAERLRSIRNLAMPVEAVPEPEAEVPLALAFEESEEIRVDFDEPEPLEPEADHEPGRLWEDELSELPRSGETIAEMVAFPSLGDEGPEVEAVGLCRAAEEPLEPVEEPAEEPGIEPENEPTNDPLDSVPAELWYDDSDAESVAFTQSMSADQELACAEPVAFRADETVS